MSLVDELRPLSAYVKEKYLQAIVDKGRVPDPGRTYRYDLLFDRLNEESDEELREALEAIEGIDLLKLKEECDYDEGATIIFLLFTDAMKELADVANFVEYTDEALRRYYRELLKKWGVMKK